MPFLLLFPVGAASADDRRGVSCQSASYAARDLLQVLLSVRAFLVALYLAFCGALAVRGVFIHASVKNAFAGLLRGLALILRVVSMRGAGSIPAGVCSGLVWLLRGLSICPLTIK